MTTARYSLAAIFFLVVLPAVPALAMPPIVLLILSDYHSAAHVGCYGNALGGFTGGRLPDHSADDAGLALELSDGPIYLVRRR